MSRKSIAEAAAKLRDEISAASFESAWPMMAAAGEQVDAALDDGEDLVTCWIAGLDHLARPNEPKEQWTRRQLDELDEYEALAEADVQWISGDVPDYFRGIAEELRGMSKSKSETQKTVTEKYLKPYQEPDYGSMLARARFLRNKDKPNDEG